MRIATETPMNGVKFAVNVTLTALEVHNCVETQHKLEIISIKIPALGLRI